MSNHDYNSFRSKCFKIYVPLSQISACIMKLSSTQFAVIIGCRSQHSHLSPNSLRLQEPKVMENQHLQQFMASTSSEEHLCPCGRAFQQDSVLTKHQCTCLKTKKCLFSALERAKEVWKDKKQSDPVFRWFGCNAIILTRSFTYPSSNGSSRCNGIVCWGMWHIRFHSLSGENT